MNPILKNIIAVIVGLVIGSIVNMAIIMISGSIIPPPEGVDLSNMESLKEAMPIFGPKHLIMPFLAHALGALVGAFLAAKIAASYKMTFAFVIGGFFLLGGIMAASMLPAPMWFNVIDIGLAYIPMAWMGGRCAMLKNG